MNMALNTGDVAGRKILTSRIRDRKINEVF